MLLTFDLSLLAIQNLSAQTPRRTRSNQSKKPEDVVHREHAERNEQDVGVGEQLETENRISHENCGRRT